MSDPLLTGQEVADRLRISLPTLYRLAEEGAIPFVRVGRQRRFTTKAVDEFIANGGAAAGAA